MRWLVEVSSLTKTDTQKYCVDAESWQRALQAARTQRGEDGPMSGFSIELLEEGYRAVDPLAKIRFVVKRAPDDMPVTFTASKDSASASVRPGVAPSAKAADAAKPASATSAASPTTKTASSAPEKKNSVPPRPPLRRRP